MIPHSSEALRRLLLVRGTVDGSKAVDVMGRQCLLAEMDAGEALLGAVAQAAGRQGR